MYSFKKKDTPINGSVLRFPLLRAVKRREVHRLDLLKVSIKRRWANKYSSYNSDFLRITDDKLRNIHNHLEL